MALGAMAVRGCGAVIGRAGALRSFSAVRAGSGPVRYNPQGPGEGKPARREEAGVSQPRPLQRWKRVAKPQEERTPWDGLQEEGSFASAEVQRLKAEMKVRDQSSPLVSRERIRPEEEASSSSSLTTRAWKKSPLPGLCYGDGRNFEGVLPSADDLFEDKLFEAAETEEDKAAEKEKEAAKNYALRLLAMAPQTAFKLRQKLSGRNVCDSVIESTIVGLQRCGLQSDLEYAEAFARSRWRSSLWGPQRLKQELRQRGVCAEDVEAALEKVFSSSDDVLESVDGDGGRWEMTREASEHLWEKAKLQWGRGGSVSAEARKRRMVGWLQRRGFNWSITSQILKSLESQDREFG